MSQNLFVSCPACDVMYQLTLEKLETGSGMLKCGMCRHIFDSRPRLQIKVNGKLQPYAEGAESNAQEPATAESGIEPELRTYLPESETQAGQPDNDPVIDDPSQLNAESGWFDSEVSILDSITVVESEFGEDWEDLPLFNAISTFVHKSRTGTAIVVFSNKSMARIYLDTGVPIAARYRKLEGKEVFRKCRNYNVLTVKFHSGKDLVNAPKSMESLLL